MATFAETGKLHARLFDYFIASGLQSKPVRKPPQPKQTPSRRYNKPRSRASDDLSAPNVSSDVSYEPFLHYVYNANKITSRGNLYDHHQDDDDYHEEEEEEEEKTHRLTEAEQLEESEILLQVKRHCYCDLKQLIERHNTDTLKIYKYDESATTDEQKLPFRREPSFNSQIKQLISNSSDKKSEHLLSIYGPTHCIQFEKFSFVFRTSHGHQMYGHCRRIYHNSATNRNSNDSNDTNKSNTPSHVSPTCLCLISSYNFSKLFDQIMDNVIMKWLFEQHESIFIFLSNILLYNNAIPPCIGDTIRVSLNKPDHARHSTVLSAASSPSTSSNGNTYQLPSFRQSKSNRYQNQHEMNNTVTLKIESVHRCDLKPLFQTLSIDKILFLISCVLTEQKLIFISSELQTLSDCIFALMSLIYPFKWQYLFCPVLSEKYINFFSSPLPYIIGIKRYLADYYRYIEQKKSSPNLVVVDLDKQEIVSSPRGLKQLPNKPTWKLKRELTRILKKCEYLMYDLNEFKHQIQINSMNSKYRYTASSQLIHKGKSRKKAARHYANSTDTAHTQTSLGLQKEFVYAIARGWDDALIYNAFLSFFIVFIGDWKKFHDETDPLSPKTPYHLKNTKKNKKTAQSQTSTTSESNAHAKLGNTQNMKQVFYSQEALEYLDQLLQTQMFKTWYLRQRNEYYQKHQKLYGVQDMYDFALLNNTQFGGLSYTGCYEFLCQTLDSMGKKLSKYVIDQIFEFTQNTECTRNTNMIDLMSSSAAIEPNTLNALLNIVNYRLYNILDNNGMNHSYALMSFYLLMKLMEQSTEKIILHCIDSYVYYAYILNKYYFNDNHVIKKQMKHITNKFIQLTSNLNELKRVRAQQVTPSDHVQTNVTKYAQLFAWSTYDIERQMKLLSSSSKLQFIDTKLIGIDFAELHSSSLDQAQQVMVLNEVLATAKNIHSYHVFAQMSQYQTVSAHEYRKRASKQEVAIIPPFMHLHKEFAIDLFGNEHVDDYIDQLKKRERNVQELKLSGSFDDDEVEDDYKQPDDDEYGMLSDNKFIQNYQQMCISPNDFPSNLQSQSISSSNLPVISPRKNATATDWQSPSHSLLDDASHSNAVIMPLADMYRAESDQTVMSQGTVMSDFDRINEMALDGALSSIQHKKKPQIMTPPAINVDVHNTYDISRNPLRNKPLRKQQLVRFKQSEDEEDDGKSPHSTELDATPQPNELDRYQHGGHEFPDETSYDEMTLGSGDDDHEDEINDLDEPPLVKFRESIRSTKTSKWEEEPLDLDSQRGRSNSRRSLLSLQMQRAQAALYEDIASEEEQKAHITITPDQQQEEKDDHKGDDAETEDEDSKQRKISYTKQSTLSPSGSTPTNMTPPSIVHTQKSAQKRPRRTLNNEIPKELEPTRQHEAYKAYRGGSRKVKDSVKDTEDENESAMHYIVSPDAMGTDDEQDAKFDSDHDSDTDAFKVDRKHTGTTTSSKGTKSMLTMDFEVNDLNVAPDYDFRDRSDTHKTSNPHLLSAAEPPSIAFTPISPLSPEPEMKVSQFYRKRKKQSLSSGRKKTAESPSVSSENNSSNGSVSSQHQEKRQSVNSVPESITSMAEEEEVDVDVEEVSSESTITAEQQKQNNGNEQHMAEAIDNEIAEHHTATMRNRKTKGKRLSRPRLLANVDLHHSGTPVSSDEEVEEADEHETKAESEHDESDSSSAITIELIPEADEPDELEDMDMDKLLSVDTPVQDAEEMEHIDSNEVKRKKSKKRKKKKKSATRKKSKDRKDKRKKKRRVDADNDMDAPQTKQTKNDKRNIRNVHQPVNNSPARAPVISGQFNHKDVHNNHEYIFSHQMMNGHHTNPHQQQPHHAQFGKNGPDMEIPPSAAAFEQLNLENLDSQQSKDSEVTQQTIKISEMMLSDEEKHTDDAFSSEHINDEHPIDTYAQSPKRQKSPRSPQTPQLPPPPPRQSKPPHSAQPPFRLKSRSKTKSKSKSSTPPKPYIPAVDSNDDGGGGGVVTPTNEHLFPQDKDTGSPFSPTHRSDSYDPRSTSRHQYTDSDGNMGKLRMGTPTKAPKRKRPAAHPKSSSNPQFESDRDQHLASQTQQHYKSSSNPGKMKQLSKPARPASSKSATASRKKPFDESGNRPSSSRIHHSSHHHRDRKKRKKVQRMSEDEFIAEPLEQFIMAGGDDFDIAKRICKYFDSKFGDTDTVAIVANKGQGPKLSYWSKANYQRKNKNVHGKYVFVYRACKHVETKCLMKKEKFEKFVRSLSTQYRKPHEIADEMDNKLGEGCHVARAKHDQFDVYCRYSNGYMADVLLPNGDFIVAWRR